MTAPNLTYIVTTSNKWGAIIHITYHEANNADQSHSSQISAEDLCRYLSAMPEADFDGDLDYWWARIPAINRNIFIAMFMEYSMNCAHYEPIVATDYESFAGDYRVQEYLRG